MFFACLHLVAYMLMTAEHKDILRRNRIKLIENMNIYVMMNDIISQCVLSAWDVETISSKATGREKCACFF